MSTRALSTADRSSVDPWLRRDVYGTGARRTRSHVNASVAEVRVQGRVRGRVASSG